jgi:hypothetical protein
MREDPWTAFSADGCEDTMESLSFEVSRIVFDAEKW